MNAARFDRARGGRTALVFGVTGQDGAYLAQLLLGKGYAVHGTSRDAAAADLGNLRRLGVRDRVSLHSVAVNDARACAEVVARVAPDEIYFLAGPSSVALSFRQPAEAIEAIVTGTLNVLEAIRGSERSVRLYHASSSECFGDTGEAAADEAAAFRPLSPYAVAKAAAHWAVANFRQAYGLFACSGIAFNHESPLRQPDFVTRKIARAAAEIARGRRAPLRLGNLAVHRDWGWAPEYVEAMWLMLQQDAPDDYVIATGESRSLKEFVATAFEQVGLDWRRHVETDETLLRPTDIARSAGNPSKAARVLGWRARTPMAEVVRRMAEAEQEVPERCDTP